MLFKKTSIASISFTLLNIPNYLYTFILDRMRSVGYIAKETNAHSLGLGVLQQFFQINVAVMVLCTSSLISYWYIYSIRYVLEHSN